MDYVKKYNEALDLAKEKKEIASRNGADITVKFLEEIFPELRESEDERIRKTLIEALKTSKTVGELKFILPEPTREEAIAWLEKQKEQKHPNGCFTCDEYKKGYEEGRRNGFTAGYNKAMKEVEQKEQKPEWSEEDEKIRGNLMSLLANMRGDRITEETYQKYYPWLKSLRPHWKPSEEQMDALRATLEYMPDTFKPRCTLITLQNDLKKL